jgi:hypothetical protein
MSPKHQSPPATITVHVPLRFTVRGGRKTIVIGHGSHKAPKTRFDNSIAKVLARAFRWKQKLDDGTYATMVELAKAERINESYVTRLVRLNLLAPDIVEAALDGRTQLTVQDLTESLSPIWTEQRTQLTNATALINRA